MRPIILKQLNYDLTPVAGLALVGHHLNRLTPVFGQIDRTLPVKGGVSNSDVLRSYLGLLVQGKSDFDAIENFRGDEFYKQSLGIGLLPSSPTLRQRMDQRAGELFDFIPTMIEQLLSSAKPNYGVLPCGWLPLDVDTFAMDNGKTVKEHVGRTYTGVDGYCPLAAYLGSQGMCLELSLRPGTQHSASETAFNFERVIPMAQRLSAGTTKSPILVRLDSGFDSARLTCEIESYNNAKGLPRVDWLIKWNPRTKDVGAVMVEREADAAASWEHPRAGKRVTVWEQAVQIEGVQRPVRRVLRLIERTIDKRGQILIMPELTLEGWTTSLPRQFKPRDIIALYADHGTHEQFHSEFKTDLDLERLPSGKFDTNYLVCELAAVAMNILRLMGQAGLHGNDAPVRHEAKRRRIKTVMQELIYRAGRLIKHGRKLIVGLGARDRATPAIMRMQGALFAASS